MRTPPIVGILAGLALLYGVWLVEPRWIQGAIGLLVLYALLTNAPRAAALFAQGDAGLRAIIAPTSAGIGGGGGRRKR